MFQSFVTVTEDGDYWRLTRPLGYFGNTDRWVVPAGFRTDFASIPRWAPCMKASPASTTAPPSCTITSTGSPSG